MADTVVIAEDGAESSGYRFSWGLAFAGGVAATATIFFLLTLGSGFGLLLVNPVTHTGPSLPGFLTGGAIYFLAAQAFGFAVGGYLAGRLLGPVVESRIQEDFRAGAHGLVAWAVTIVATMTMVAITGLAAGGSMAALYGSHGSSRSSATPTAYLVDKLFRPSGNQQAQAMQAAPAAAPATTAAPGEAAPAATDADNASDTAAPANGMQAAPATADTGTTTDSGQAMQDRAEAGRILTASTPQMQVTGDDRTRLASLVARNVSISESDANSRIDAVTTDARNKAQQAADVARKAASYASLWIALSLLFGALVSIAAAISARIEDDRESVGGVAVGTRGFASGR